ncbi:ABC transporter ATP-binding protein [Acerihabitans arboris]|uniref:ATP-binding cassette domain-containing protein n=1 Tax=Acerihabitans arboris TaxID=2691583 RepID=A0A845SRR6_9GAMM|nr:ABC transporter ATP-binding protein [Acerihabitans arboris]NDL63815.1 ATP-binding cassette domain-containing protein [Acerihabitans arboris]
MSSAVSLENVTRRFNGVPAVDGLTLDIPDGEFFSLLGPSGSGKSTCLRLIAGFEQPDSGVIRLHGTDTASLPPYQRDVNTVFQDYALFPHMSLLDNVAYGLMVKGVGRAERMVRARAALARVELRDVLNRKPAHLSGGQRQRVALARALVNEPRILLLDEPLGALDLKLREQMQGELKTLQRELGITFIFVTHDQGEALSMSDRVAVFDQGRIEQVDTPRRLYFQPRSRFVANFVGSANVIGGELARELTGENGVFAVRPEFARISVSDRPARSDELSVTGELSNILFQGAITRYELVLAGGTRFSVSETHPVRSSIQEGIALGQRLTASWPRTAMSALEE